MYVLKMATVTLDNMKAQAMEVQAAVQIQADPVIMAMAPTAEELAKLETLAVPRPMAMDRARVPAAKVAHRRRPAS